MNRQKRRHQQPPASSSQQQLPPQRSSWMIKSFYLVVAVCIVLSVFFNVVHHNLAVKQGFQYGQKVAADFTTMFMNTPQNDTDRQSYVDNPVASDVDDDKSAFMGEVTHQLGGLSCSKYGGPSEDIAAEMVYWSDIPSDESYVSPFYEANGGRVKYMTFEPDGGGWNNIRMAMETVVVMAHATGRTLVMPPEQGIYLLRKDRAHQKVHFGFADFFHLDTLDMEHKGMTIITMEEFLIREAMTGNLRNMTSGEISFPPYNRTDWNKQDSSELKDWLRQVALTPFWTPSRCLAAFPASANEENIQKLKEMHSQIAAEGYPEPRTFDGKPTQVDAPAIDRMREVIERRRELCVYDKEMQEAHVVHFICSHKLKVRLLIHFYAFVFFEDWKQDLWTKRFVRDHLRYVDHLQCTAARVVHAIRERARQRNPVKNPDGTFDSFHVRRGDFQFKATRVDADVLHNSSKDIISDGTTVFIATDERNKRSFFTHLAEHYDICFLDDFQHLFPNVNTNYYGMLDQLIASKGRNFFGTYHSTFTGFINRMRGSCRTKHRLSGYQDGTMPTSYYFVPPKVKYDMLTYKAIKRQFFSREFPISWRDIDRDIDEYNG